LKRRWLVPGSNDLDDIALRVCGDSRFGGSQAWRCIPKRLLFSDVRIMCLS
jgi:hypothetical protein